MQKFHAKFVNKTDAYEAFDKISPLCFNVQITADNDYRYLSSTAERYGRYANPVLSGFMNGYNFLNPASFNASTDLFGYTEEYEYNPDFGVSKPYKYVIKAEVDESNLRYVKDMLYSYGALIEMV